LSSAPKVTIGISFRNPGRYYFSLALKSVFAQTFTDWELILMDDGSSDDSLALARSIKDPRVRVYSDGLNKRMNIRFNELVGLARAPYLFRMDADDIMHPERLERQYAELVRCDSDTVIGCNAYSIDANSNIVGLRYLPAAAPALLDAPFIHPSVAAATEWFRRHPYSESFAYHRAQDVELWCRTACSSTFVNLHEALLYYREAGVFSYENYIGSQLGLLFLLRTRFSRPRTRYTATLLKIIVKLFLVSLYDTADNADKIVARRYQRLTPDQRQQAEAALARVLSCPLPT